MQLHEDIIKQSPGRTRTSLRVKAARKITHEETENTRVSDLLLSSLQSLGQSSRFGFNQACLILIIVLNCDDGGGDGHFLLAAPGPPQESHKAVARVRLYRGPSDRKKRRVPACASAGEGPSARH